MTEPQSRGVYAAVLTPLTGALEPDLARFVAHCQWLLANGCDGLAPLGTTGEANSLSVAQRLALVEAAARGGVPMAKCIIGTGSCALADAVTMTKAVVAAGGGGALLLPPFYYKNPSEDGLFGFFSEVIERVASPRLKLYLYHFPQLSTVPITVKLVARLKRAHGDIIAGLKDSSGDWECSASFLREFPGFGVFSGSEEFLLANLRAGGVGCISASTNVTAPLARPVYLAWREGEAEGLQHGLTAVRLVLQSYPLQAALKEVMARVSGDRSWRVLLPPNRPLTQAEGAALAERLEALPQMRPILRRAA
jgi:4-hydroxy-tetrahydrodipicolinate synthase